MVVLTYLVLLQVWCRLCDICWWEPPGRTRRTGRTWTPAEGKTPFYYHGGENTESECFSSDREHGSLTGFLLVSSRVSFHALTGTWTGMKNWWTGEWWRMKRWRVLTWTRPHCWHTGWPLSRLSAGPRCDSLWDYSPAESYLYSTNDTSTVIRTLSVRTSEGLT